MTTHHVTPACTQSKSRPKKPLVLRAAQAKILTELAALLELTPAELLEQQMDFWLADMQSNSGLLENWLNVLDYNESARHRILSRIQHWRTARCDGSVAYHAN